MKNKLKQQLETNIWKIKLFRVSYDFMIVIPILVIFFLAKGLSMTEVFLLQSFFALLMLVTEVPSGYMADKLGRKRIIVFGSVLYFIGFALYPFGETFWYFAFIEGLIGIGASMISGADSALLYDSLVSLKRKDEYHKIESKMFGYVGYSLAIAAIIGGFLATKDILYPFYLQAFAMFLVIPISLSFKEAPISEHETDEKQKGMMWVVKHTLHHNKKIKWLILFTAFLHTSTLVGVWFAQPFWEHIGIPISLFGIVFASLSFSRGFFAHLSVPLEKTFGYRGSLFILILSVFIGFLGLAIFDKYIGSLVFFLFFQVAYGAGSPILKDYINKLTSSHVRATVLSIQSMVGRLSFVILGPLVGYSLDILSYRETFLLTGFVFFLVGFISLSFMMKHR